jgi:superfamily II DNA/RNA helicase
MRFNPIEAAKKITNTYRDYMKGTFFIRDEEFRKAYYERLDDLEFSKGPYLECVDAFLLGKSLSDLVHEQLMSPKFKELFKHDPDQFTRPLYKHQEDALRVALAGKNMVVTTGTGSGKTECFLYPVIHYLLEQEKNGMLSPGVRILLLYPMNALANDQMQRLRELLKDSPSITFGSYTGETEETRKDAVARYRLLHDGELPLDNELVSREQMKETPPHILVTNYAMLEYLLVRPADNVFFDDPRFNGFWKYIVLDEAHVYSGASGMEVSILLRRLAHRLPTSESLQFIMTSATLGDDTKDKEILHFASSLCAGKSFSDTSIIRAKRKETNFEATFSGNGALYQDILNLLENDSPQPRNEIKDDLLNILKKYHIPIPGTINEKKAEEILYDVFCHDQLYAKIRNRIVEERTVNFADLRAACNIDSPELVNFIQITSSAVKNKSKLLDARYHHFIRTLEGAYVSFAPQKDLSLIPVRSRVIDGKEYRYYKLSVCQFCGELYFEGTLKGQHFFQDQGETRQTFMRIDESYLEFEDDGDGSAINTIIEKRNRTFRLCSACGQMVKFAEHLDCGCGATPIFLYATKTDDDGVLHRCARCGTKSRNSVLRGFYLGQDASTAVVGESLFMQIPEKDFYKRELRTQQPNNPFAQNIVEPKPPKKSKQLLLFSDSRQEAAYFASYFQYTYDFIFYRRIMMAAARKLIRQHPDTYGDHIPLLHLIEEMKNSLSTIDNKQSPQVVAKKIWSAVIGELMDVSRNSLRGVGWLEYQLGQGYVMRASYPPETPWISSEQMESFCQFVLLYFLRLGAISTGDEVTFAPADWKAIVFGESQPCITKSKGGAFISGFAQKAFVPQRDNGVTEFLKRGFDKEQDDIDEFLNAFFDHYLIANEIILPVLNKPTLFRVNPDKVVVRVHGSHPIESYRCKTCGQISTVNIHNKCPIYRCAGLLEPYDSETSDAKDYFINQYGPEVPATPISIKEHTAQLNKETAKKYQQGFIDGDINILSCTTTFEMGVDVGKLETVFMKNVPPRPSNYVQRAGRAGRRLNSAAFSLTFCKLGPHDFYYFDNPIDMINGVIQPPSFKIDNSKIVSRHVWAVLLADYWKRLLPNQKDISEFFEENSFDLIMDFLENVPETTMEYLERVVPSSLVDLILDFIKTYKKRLTNTRNMYLEDVSKYDEAYDEEDRKDRNNKDTRLMGWLMKVKRTYENEKILTFFSKSNLIPKYGFPVDTVTLFTDAHSRGFTDDSSKLSLQRDLIQAISEYAPDSEVVADGMMYTSRYIKMPRTIDYAWKPKLVLHCSNQNCGKINVMPHINQDVSNLSLCDNCGKMSVSSQIMLIPEYGFIIQPDPVEVKTKRPQKTARTEFYYLGQYNKERAEQAKKYRYGNTSVSVISSPDDELMVMNKSTFLVCSTCGYAVKAIGKVMDIVDHNNPRGYPCPNKKLIQRSLGHIFKTDVALISINEHIGNDEATTIMYAFLEGCSRYFDIERDDIDGCFTYQSYASEGATIGTTFVLFDSVPGGAGNVRRIYDCNQGQFREFLESALERVSNCNCGGEEGTAVCYSCLANFRNQYDQERMQRKYAIDFIKKMLVDTETVYNSD